MAYRISDKRWLISKPNNRGFTIVELLVVIVVIGILATITIVSYTGIQQKAVVASLTSDLDNASKQLKLFQVDNSNYPTTINCAIPDSSTNKCIKASLNTTYQYTSSNSNPQLFCITATKDTYSYNIGQDTIPLAGPCPILRLDAGNITSYPASGTVWTDLSSNGYNGVLYNGVGYSTSGGGSLSFDGSNDYVEIANPLPIFSDSFTMSMWIYLNGANERDILIGDYAIPGGINVNFERGSNNELRLYWNAAPDISTGVGVVSPGRWQNVIVVRDRTSSKVQFYVDSAKVFEYNGALSDKVATIKHYIGKDSRDGTTAFNGLISNVNIYNKALSASEILQNFNTIKGRYGL